MPDYTPNEIVDILLTLGECQGNYRRTAALYRNRFPRRRHPNHVRIHFLERRTRRGVLSRQRFTNNQVQMRNPRFFATLAIVHLDPHISLRTIQRELGVPRSTCSRYLRLANYHPYHITLNQDLNEVDCQRRIIFCRWAVEQIRDNPYFFNFVMFSDEAKFSSTGILNRHNCHYWSPINPHWMQQIDNQHRWSINVWCGIINGHLIGPFFFNDTVNSESYLELLRNHLPILLEDLDLRTRNTMWLQQDGASPHFARIVRDFLNQHFPNRWIGRNGPIEWPARSPDLTSPDFYLWGYIKDLVYRERPTTREDMIIRIQEACANIPRDVLLRTVTHFHRRIQLCLQVNGATFEHLLP